MQSFINTFIDAYLEKKAYLPNAKVVIDAGANIDTLPYYLPTGGQIAKIIA